MIIMSKRSSKTTRRSHTRTSKSGKRTRVQQHSVRRKINPRNIIDGDTFRTTRSINGENQIRIANFNAPELNQSGGKAAKNKLTRLLGNKTITIKPKAKDKYGRIIADVVVNKKDVKKQMK